MTNATATGLQHGTTSELSLPVQTRELSSGFEKQGIRNAAGDALATSTITSKPKQCRALKNTE